MRIALLKKAVAGLCVAAGVWGSLAAAPAHAHSEASAVLSLLPVASVVGVAGAGSAVAGAAVALPVALSATFMLSKFVRDSQSARRGAGETPLWW